jgi:hypothetical protein
MKNTVLNYSTPEVKTFEVAAECGYADSVLLPGFGIYVDEEDFI